jgi:hypothetical protein
VGESQRYRRQIPNEQDENDWGTQFEVFHDKCPLVRSMKVDCRGHDKQNSITKFYVCTE